MTEDKKLLSQYMNNSSEAAFGQLVARHLTLVYSTCLRDLQSPPLAEDAAQIVFLLLARKAKSFHSNLSLAGWLYKTARFVARDVRKQEARRQRGEQSIMQEMTHRQEPCAPEWECVEPLLNNALSALKSGEREAILLRFVEGHSLAETGVALGLSEDAARMRVSRAVEKMRRFLTSNGIVVTGAVLTGLLTSEAARPVPTHATDTITQGTLQALSGGPTANVLLLSKGVYQTMKIIKVKFAALAAAVLLAGAALPPLARALGPHKTSVRVLATPAPLTENVTTKFTLDKDQHAFYSATLPKGASMIILDTRRAESKAGEMKVNLSLADKNTSLHLNGVKSLDEVGMESVSAEENRVVALSSLKKPKSLIFDIHNQGVQCQYWLTVLSTPPAVNATGASPSLAVPRFGETLPGSIVLGETKTGRLESNRCAYFVISLPAGRYKSLLGFGSVSGKPTDLNGEVLISTEKGLPLFNEEGLPATNGDFKNGDFLQVNELHSFNSDNQDMSRFTLKQDGVFLITIENQIDKPGGSAAPVNFTEQIVSDISPVPVAKQN